MVNRFSTENISFLFVWKQLFSCVSQYIIFLNWIYCVYLVILCSLFFAIHFSGLELFEVSVMKRYIYISCETFFFSLNFGIFDFNVKTTGVEYLLKYSLFIFLSQDCFNIHMHIVFYFSCIHDFDLDISPSHYVTSWTQETLSSDG